MNKMLIIVDPQVDFVSGALPVPGAESAMDALALHVASHGDEYSRIIVTADRHPMQHCSFDSCGGQWPRHCVADSVGAAVWPRLMDALYAFAGSVTFLHKGERADTEEYSIFANAEARRRIVEMIETEGIDRVDICGLAGDVCVAATLTDGMHSFGTGLFKVLTAFSPSIDGGATLDNIISKYGLLCDR